MMQKEVLVNKSLYLTIVCFIFLKYSFSQKKISGTYSNLYEFQEHYNYINFEKNFGFEYHSGASLGDDFYGKGTYNCNNDLLILNYNKTKPIQKGSHTSYISINTKNNVSIAFSFFSLDSIKIPYVNILYEIDGIHKGAACDANGNTIIKLKKDITKIIFQCSVLNYEPYSLTVDLQVNSNIVVYLQKSGLGLPICNQVDTLKILKKKADYFIVKDINGETTKWSKINSIPNTETLQK